MTVHKCHMFEAAQTSNPGNLLKGLRLTVIAEIWRKVV